jgi:hypothetical protein
MQNDSFFWRPKLGKKTCKEDDCHRVFVSKDNELGCDGSNSDKSHSRFRSMTHRWI